MRRRRSVILAVVLVMIGLLALSMAGFLFFVRAETAGMVASSDGQQARLAAESGFEELVSVLRLDRHNPAAWYDNPDRFRHALVWGDGFKRDSDPLRRRRSRKDMFESGERIAAAWRYSLVSQRLDGPEDAIRFGAMPESGKLNLNTASDDQITQLLTPLLSELGIDNPREIIDPILDWRDADSDVRPNGAENEYYQRLKPAYNAKNGRFDTVEELLLVKGVTAAILYGEDVNRNGVLDANEDDGDASFPEYDNADGTLNRGIAPYLTVYSREVDTALDNKPRINLRADGGVIAAQIAELLPNGELSPATVAFLTNLGGAGVNAALLASPADLFPPGPDEEYTPPASAAPAGQGARGGDASTGGAAGGGGRDEPPSIREGQTAGQIRATPGGNGKPGGSEKATQDTAERGEEDGGGRAMQSPGGGPQSQPGGRGGRGGRGGQGSGGITAESMFNALKNSPVTVEELPYIMDRFSTRAQQQAGLIEGLVNINAAPYRVLVTVPGMTPEAAGRIVGTRATLDPAMLATTAWPLTSGAVDGATWKRIAPHITTKAYQFHVEIVGYADHVKTARRYEWVIEMIGPMAQVKYFRDLTSLGFAWPVDDESVLVTR